MTLFIDHANNLCVTISPFNSGKMEVFGGCENSSEFGEWIYGMQNYKSL